MNGVSRWVLGFLVLLAVSSGAMAQSARPELLIYCGITMVKPMTEIAQRFETRENAKVTISQGGSESLYQSLKKSRLGDLYLPGEPSYREKYLSEGLLGDYKVVGHNRLAMVVPKGNPRKVKADPRELLRKDLTIILGSKESGSVGLESKTMLDKLGIYPQAVARAALLLPDSRALSAAMRRGDAELTLNWRATGFVPENAAVLEVLDLDPRIAPPQALMLTELTFSRQQALARKFIDFASSDEGRNIFRKHGFVEDK